MQLPIDTGSFAIIIEQGKYLPSATSQPTDLGEYIQFNGASKDGTVPAEVRRLRPAPLELAVELTSPGFHRIACLGEHRLRAR